LSRSAHKIREKRTIPSFVEEWMISRFQKPDKSNAEVYADITSFMSKHLPSKTEKETIKYRLHSGDSVVLLDRFEVRIDISKGKKLLTIPCLLEGGQWGAGRCVSIRTVKTMSLNWWNSIPRSREKCV
jgi:ATP-dependent Lon protease